MNWLGMSKRQIEIRELYTRMFISLYKIIAISNNYDEVVFLENRKSNIKTWSAKWFYTDCHKIQAYTDREIVTFAIIRLYQVEAKHELNQWVLHDLVEFVFDENYRLSPGTLRFFYDPVHREVW